MRFPFQILGVISLSVFWATAAQATFSCEVLPLPEGAIELHELPDAASPVILMVPMGAIVSEMSGDESVQGVWVQVAYSADPEAHWGAGGIGWVQSDQLGDCG